VAYDPRLYALVHTGNVGDVAFYLEQCKGAPRVLELGVGYGRVMRELLRAGHQVTGVDLHEGLLALARSAVAALPPPLRARATLRRGDMTKLSFAQAFERVVIPHSGLYCLLDDRAVLACLRGARRALAKGGRLILDAYAADAFHHDSTPDDQSDDHRDELTTIEVGERSYRVYEQSSWDRDRQIIVATYAYVDEQTGEEELHAIKQRYLLLPQLEALLGRAGFAIERVCGDFAGAPYDEESDVITVEARPL
jgi:SAM-dependent methyltransferase